MIRFEKSESIMSLCFHFFLFFLPLLIKFMFLDRWNVHDGNRSGS